jgi:hypothetical protein
MIFPGFDASGTAYQTNVVGLLNGTNGSLKWSGVYTTSQTGLTSEDHRFIFGADGSLFLSIKTVNLLASATDTLRVARVRPDGSLAYSKTLSLPGAIHEHQFYLGSQALVYYTHQQGGTDAIQFVVLDADGNVGANAALNAKLRGSGQIKLSAARREGTDFAFIRLECGFTGFTLPEHTLMRLNLSSGAMEFRKVPTPAPGVETYDVVTTPNGDALSPHNNFRGLAAVTTAMVGSTQVAAGGSRVAFYELPSDGSLPACMPLSPSSVTAGSTVTPQLAAAVHIDLTDGATVTSRTMPGMIQATALPTLQATPLTETVICPDDGGGDAAPTLAIRASGPGEVTVSWAPGTAGFVLQEKAALATGDWAPSASGAANPVVLPIARPTTFYRLIKP